MNKVLAERNLPTGQTIQIVQGDITTEEVDAIINAANEHLQHGGGVAWAISKKGGPSIQKESDAWIRHHGTVSHAHPAWTSGGDLPARYVIHAVGPRMGEGDEDRKLHDATTAALKRAEELRLESIALPGISTGIFGYPIFGGMGGVSFVSQFLGSLAAIAFALASGFLVYGLLAKTIGIRLNEDEEFAGPDLTIHHTGAYPEESVR